MNNNIPSGWIETTLGEVCEIKSGSTPSTKEESFWDGDIAWITPKDLSNYNSVYISKGERNITQVGLKNSSAQLLPKNTILFSSRAPIGYVAIAQNELTTNQGFKNLVCDEKKSHFRFFYYLLKEKSDHIEKLSSGSTFSEASASVMRSIQILLPPLPEQQAIASVLSAFDDKIELLREQNKTLEQIGQTVFQEWFGKYSPDRPEELPEGWRVGKLGEVISIIESGSRPKGGIDPNLKEGIPSVGAESINGIGNYDFSNTKYITKNFFASMNRGKVKDYDVLIYKDGAYVGKKAMYGKGFPFEKFAINEHVFILRFLNWFDQFYVYFYVKQDELSQLNTNSAQPGLNQEAMKLFKILLPPENQRIEFSARIKENIDKILFNYSQIQSLSRTRDELLPRLMSGEVRVK